MADAHIKIPDPVNEPVRSYAPGSAEKGALKTRLAELTDARTEIPLVIDGKAVAGNGRADLRSPQRKDLVIGEYALGQIGEVGAAIDAALRAREEWARTPFSARAAVFLR